MSKTTVTTRVPPPYHEVATRFWNTIISPVAAWLALMLAMAAIRLGWPGGWTLLAVAVAGVAATVVAWHHTAGRRGLGRWLPVITAAAAAIWMPTFIVLGPVKPVFGIWAVGGFILVAFWWARLVTGSSHHGVDLARHFASAAENTSWPGARLRNIIPGRNKVEAEIHFEPGTVVSEATGRVEEFESGLGVPPGTLSAIQHDEYANAARATFTDPKYLQEPMPWPGPSADGASITEPLRIGKYQDTEDLMYPMTGHHRLMMGITGSGKTQGGAYSAIAEIVTRHDAAVLAADIANGDLFLGPLEPALHQMAITGGEVIDMLRGVHRALPARKAHLAARRLGKWEPGCGLTYLFLWLEEMPDILDLLKEEDELGSMLRDTRAMRAAGISVTGSVQRGDYTQMPTFLRGQLAASWCFGVKNRKDAEFGLSPAQIERGCRPQLWGDRLPGMFVLDAPTIPVNRVAVPARGWYWGPDTRQIGDYMAERPWQQRPLDPVTAGALSLPGPGQRTLHAVRDPLPAAKPAKPAPAAETPRKSRKHDQRESLAALREQIGVWASEGQYTWTAKDLHPLCAEIGKTPQWVYEVMRYLVQEGEAEQVANAFPRCWRLAGDKAGEENLEEG